MSSSLFARAYAVLPIVAAASLAEKEGYFFKRDAANKAIAIAAATDVPAGLILATTGDGLEISGGIPPLPGTVRVKLGAAVTDLRKALTLRADGSAQSDAGTGARVQVAIPLEIGAADELVEAVLINPVTLA